MDPTGSGAASLGRGQFNFGTRSDMPFERNAARRHRLVGPPEVQHQARGVHDKLGADGRGQSARTLDQRPT
jgi:hypothetical protein